MKRREEYVRDAIRYLSARFDGADDSDGVWRFWRDGTCYRVDMDGLEYLGRRLDGAFNEWWTRIEYVDTLGTTVTDPGDWSSEEKSDAQ